MQHSEQLVFSQVAWTGRCGYAKLDMGRAPQGLLPDFLQLCCLASADQSQQVTRRYGWQGEMGGAGWCQASLSRVHMLPTAVLGAWRPSLPLAMTSATSQEVRSQQPTPVQPLMTVSLGDREVGKRASVRTGRGSLDPAPVWRQTVGTHNDHWPCLCLQVMGAGGYLHSPFLPGLHIPDKRLKSEQGAGEGQSHHPQ